MIDQHFWSVTATPEVSARVFGPLQGGERVVWRGRAGVAEYAFEKHASLPRWTLPESTELMVTDQRVMYACTASDSPDDVEVTSGELRWLWPQHLRVQPGARETGRSASTTQIQLVCGGSDGSWPALVFAGGDLKSVADADRLANLLRQVIARFRVDNAGKLGLTTNQSRLLSRLLIGPEFSNYQGGPGQTVSLQGALTVSRPATATDPAPVSPDPAPISADPAPVSPAPAYSPSISPVAAALAAPTPAPVSPAPMLSRTPKPSPAHRAPEPAADLPQPVAGPHRSPVGEGATRVISVRPGMAADVARALQAANAEAATQEAEPHLASRAADLAARVASLVSRSATLDDDAITAALGTPASAPIVPRPAEPAPAGSVDLESAARFDEVSTTNLAERAEILRRSAARFAANSASSRAINRRAERDPGATLDLGATRSNRTT
jgi:hypothetical protein